MDVKHCRAFVAVAEHLHFTKAANALNMTQPTLTHLIQQLEQSLGLSLLNRSTRQVELTQMGEVFLPLARNVVHDLKSAIDHMKDMAELRRGKVSIAAFPSVAANKLPPLVVSFEKQFPGVEVIIRDGIWENIIRDIQEGTADFAITSEPKNMESFAFTHMYDDFIHLLCLDTHPYAQQKSVCWRDISNEKLILLSDNTGIRQSINQALGDTTQQFKSVYEPALIQTVVGLVAAGAGLGVVHSSYQQVTYQENIVSLPIEGPIVRRPVGILTRKDRQLTPAAKTLLAMTLDHFTSNSESRN
ncbi:LysR family transcriptional regulator [Sneathiella limimaris]|uniref:LysR family transcriptional regulator n=1 Tax=Sneathiella limimaris TaxID=1964213 RepID=UPI00146B4B44|nr:LysR family transcriptional regulator [Sneathiella limimaris]